MMQKWIKTGILISLALSMGLSCSSNQNRKIERVEPQIFFEKDDTCSIENVTEISLFIFSNQAEVAEINCHNKKIGRFELLGNSQNNYHYVITIKNTKISDSIVINNLSRSQSISIPYKKEYDAVGIDWRGSIIEVNYSKSCSFIK